MMLFLSLAAVVEDSDFRSFLWAGAGALEGVQGGDGVPWPAAGSEFFRIFLRDYAITTWFVELPHLF